ncbi:MAG: glutamate synthase subunit alpha, partial [Gloeomargaritaceae cyanobacterium C42_A2020_066]|nr:glutamate synthase subunit alpha [Gloeomargaritaceae cyanobacterium C42_A2020_066]
MKPQGRDARLSLSGSPLPWLTEERDACGVGLIADRLGRPSHTLVQQALKALDCLEHRGACSADRDSGDGAGVMTGIPWNLFQAWFTAQGLAAPDPSYTAVGMFFLPLEAREVARQLVDRVLREQGLTPLVWRAVPVRPEVLGEQARANRPQIEQVFIHCPRLEGDALENHLYLVRKRIERAAMAVGESWSQDFYICSLSSRRLIYKGMVRSAVLGQFYTDLTDPTYTSPFAIYHRRFSTNTMPKWPLAQPMRLLGHNGEINTLLGNINWMVAREANLQHPAWGEHIQDLRPVVNPRNSDSSNLDNALELLVRSGRSPLEALMILVPEAYQQQPELANYPEIIDFYEYYAGLQEPWDGPALIVFSDGKVVGATLDRNGLRPARYTITHDDLVIVASEAGVVEVEPERVLEKGRLGPGQMLAVDLERHEVLHNWAIKQRVAGSSAYGEWLQEYRQELTRQPFQEQLHLDTTALLRLQTAFGYTAEDVDMVIEPMATTGKEATFCMGDDSPLAVLSSQPHLLYDYFKQRFAQVTNPAIDPLRESLVMSLAMTLGAKGNLLEPRPQSARLVKLASPVLNEAEIETLKTLDLRAATLSTLFPIQEGPAGLAAALTRLCEDAAGRVRGGCDLLILSDRAWDLTGDLTWIPPLLAVGAVHHHLI